MQELEQNNTNTDISLLLKIQSFLEKAGLHGIKIKSSPPFLLEGLHFREINKTS